MNNFEKLVVALLVIIAIATAATAVCVEIMSHRGFEVELSE